MAGDPARSGEGGRGPRGAAWLPAAGAALLVLVVAAVVAIGLPSVYQGWRLTHPARQPVRGDPATEASLEYRCLPYLPPLLCRPLPLFTPRQHIPISAWILPSVPQNYPEGPANWSGSTVILVFDHGQSKTPTDFPVWSASQVLVAAGYNVVLFDTRGQGQSGGAGIGFGTLEVSDLLTVADYLPVLGGPPQGFIAVWGFGTGADTAILAAARDPNISAVIADSPYLTPQAYLRRQLPQWTGLPAFPFASSILWAMQRETDVNYAAYNPLTAAARLGGRNARPLLVVVGGNDQVTPPSDAEQLFQAAGRRAFEYVVPGAGHLQAYADSPLDPAAPGVNTYACYVLNTLKVMQSSAGNAAPTGPGGPCGGYGGTTQPGGSTSTANGGGL